MMIDAIRRSVTLLAGLALASCTSTAALEPRLLPFHVVVVPLEAPVAGHVSPGELPGERTDLSLELSSERLTNAVSAALEEYCFARVTILNAHDLNSTVDAFERQRLILEQSRAVHADMIVELDLRYDSEIFRDTTSTFWLNYPLFLFLGPSNWFLLDNGYFADVELTTSIYDLNVLEASALDLGDAAARVITANSRYSGTQLSFFSRADGIEDYLLGIFLPSGHLSRESTAIVGELEQDLFDELRTQAVQGIQSRRTDLIRADWIAPVYVEPDQVQVIRDGGEVIVRGTIRLHKNSQLERFQTLRIELGSDYVVAQPVPTPLRDTPDSHVASFEARIAASANASEVQLKCQAGSRDRYVRTYTFPIPGSKSGLEPRASTKNH